MSRKYIGVFDSGLGGLTTVRSLIEKLPQENVVFLGDTKNVPYGSKNREEILSLACNNIAFLRQYDLKAIVIACNTVDSNVGDKLRRESDIRLLGVLDPAAKKAAEITVNGRIGVLATEMTVRSETYKNRIHIYNSKAEVFQAACPLLVPMIESGDFINKKEATKKALLDYLKPLIAEDIDTLVLGCTHYDVLIDMCKKEYPDLKIVSSSRLVIDDLLEYLKDDLNDQKEVTRLYYVSSDPDKFIDQARLIIPNINVIKTGESD
ncbi:MAG: glutamate racemase [Erysipelotrichaceae bacterium]|nr:glutamate racemase [Erysipelotrichaceae bacterium]MCR5096934.1 glutamate racemase [Erysipelotrichaceae bacterium]